jgi:hypothetical protein
MSLLRASSRTLRATSLPQGQAVRAVQRRTLTTAPVPARSPLRTGLYAAALTAATGAFLVYYFDARSALHRYVVTPALRQVVDAETGQKIAVKVLRSGLGPRDPVSDDEVLRAEVRTIQHVSNLNNETHGGLALGPRAPKPCGFGCWL